MKPIILTKEKHKRLINWFISNKTRILLIIFLYPNIVCFTPDSTGTSNTFIDLMLGLGKYANVTYNCEGQATSVTNYTYFDFGAGITHKIDVLNLGLRSGGLTINDTHTENTNHSYSYYQYDYEIPGYSTIYINPFIGLNTKYFELNGGVLWFSNIPGYESNLDEYLFFYDSNMQLSGDMRIGNNKAFHFTTQYLSNVPLLSGTGMYDMGIGFGSKESRNLTWIGLSVGPFQNEGFAIKQNIEITDQFDILLKGRIGQIESNLEGSISAGARYNF